MEIRDYHRYVTLMHNGFYDKMFFVNKLFENWSSMIDFGCADGFLTKIIAQVFPEKQIYGYDDSKEMISTALNTGEMPENARFVFSSPGNCDIINLSSVLHEIYNKEEDIKKFISFIKDTNPRCIIIRDMQLNDKYCSISARGLTQIVKNVREWTEKVNKKGELIRYEMIYGDIHHIKSLQQFLLKYPYIDGPNWDRELNEDYSLFSYKNLIKRLENEGLKYTPSYYEEYCLPYLKHKWKKTFGLEDNKFLTHVKTILWRE